MSKGFAVIFFVVSSLAVLAVWEASGDPASKDVEAGRRIYQKRCVYCHGPEGGGDGPAASFLNPRPRDFTQGLFKIRTTPSGELPTDEDIFRTITRGMPGAAMPDWKNLSRKERWQLVSYLKTFSELFTEEAPSEKLRVGKRVPPTKESIAKGQELYKRMKCWECHGEEGRGDGPSAPTLEDDWGFPIRATNLTRGWSFRGGDAVEDIYRTILTGFNGTPMPSFADSLSKEEAWHLANYVRSLSSKRKAPGGIRQVVRSRFVKGDIPAGPRDRRWRTARPTEILLVGQITKKPRLFTPSIDFITIRSLYNDREIGFLLQWDDPTKSVPKPKEGIFSDAVAIQFPVKIPDGPERPYFLMGDPMDPVNIWRWRADAGSVRELNATGLGTEALQASESQGVSGKGAFTRGQWQVVMKRSLATEDKEDDIQVEKGRFIPIAFAAWDGSNGEIGGKCSISTWHYLLRETPGGPTSPPPEPPRAIHPPSPIDYVGLENPFRGDKKNFKRHVEEGARLYFSHCFFCHGDKLDGRGHFAPGFLPRPADFTDPETISVLKGSYLLWRIMEGGPDLPPESRPWDSAMPSWKDDLTEEEIWKIILYLYEAIEATPKDAGDRRSHLQPHLPHRLGGGERSLTPIAHSSVEDLNATSCGVLTSQRPEDQNVRWERCLARRH
ncbi:MAG: c-type cytochrome [Candidatus Methylomirabilales bacterium]